jgi:hypothetical protein
MTELDTRRAFADVARYINTNNVMPRTQEDMRAWAEIHKIWLPSSPQGHQSVESSHTKASAFIASTKDADLIVLWSTYMGKRSAYLNALKLQAQGC